MAIAFQWGGQADTDVPFSSFFNADHTLALRFMPQFPDSYISVMVGHRSTAMVAPGQTAPAPFFAVGQGIFASGSPALFLRVGAQEVPFKAPLKALTWHHLAVTRKGNDFTLFLDGETIGSPVTQAVQAPNGTALRFGSTARWQQIGSGVPVQFYGFLDDVGIFKGVLSKKKIKELVDPAGSITGLEKNLVAGFLFPKKLPPNAAKVPKALRFVSGNSRTTNQSVSFGHDDHTADAKLLPFPPPEQQVNLPCAKGQLLWIAQSPWGIGPSHQGSKNFIYDITPVTLAADFDLATKESPPVKEGVLFQAPSPGSVQIINAGFPPGDVDPKDTNEMWTSIDGQPQHFWRHLHWKANTAVVANGAHVQAGASLAEIGKSGVKDIHHHQGLFWFAPGTQPPPPSLLTIPFAFKDYFQLDRKKVGRTFKDTWKTVKVGMPTRGDVVTWGSHP
jgi:hypothetical protein